MEPEVDVSLMVDQRKSTKMDEYERKFAEMQKYIPFLEAMIARLKRVKDKSRASQLQKMQSLHGILSDSTRKLKIETLQRCEEVLQKLHNKVEKGTPMSTSSQNNKNNEDTKLASGGHLEPKIECPPDKTPETINEDPDTKQKKVFVKKMEDDETPASPSPPASPDQITQPKTIKPIIIPTERSDSLTGNVTNDRPASPDACEMIATIVARAPIIIPTEREDVRPAKNPLRKVDPEPVNKRTSTWNYSTSGNNQGIVQSQNLWQSDSSSAGNIGDSSKNTDTRARIIRHIPTVPTPSKGSGCVLRKPVLILDKKNPITSETEISSSKHDSPCNTEPRMFSPDGDSHSQKNAKTSPKSKELTPLSKLSVTELLVSPPPVLGMPPLTSEDIAELMDDGGDSKTNEKSEISNKKNELKKGSERVGDETKKSDKDTESKSPNAGTCGINKDAKSTKSFSFTQTDVDRETERRWEEIDRPIVKLQNHQAGRRIFSSPSSTVSKHTDPKPSVSASQTNQGSSSTTTERPADPRNRPPSPSKEREPQQSEPRYTDNYEKHPRQSRDTYKHNSVPNSMNSAFTRNSDNEVIPNTEDRGNGLYQRRHNINNASSSHNEVDPRRDSNKELYKTIMQRERERERQMERERQREHDRILQHERELEMQRERERDIQLEQKIEREMLQSANRGMIHHSPGRGPESWDQSQWGQNMNYPQCPQGPNMYPQQQRPDMWMPGGPNNMPIEPLMMNEPGLLRPQYPGPQNSCGRPMLSPQDMNMVPIMDMNIGPCMDMNMGRNMDMNVDMNMGRNMDMNVDMNMGRNMDMNVDMNMGRNMDMNMDMNMVRNMDMNMGHCMDQGFRDDMPNPNMGPQPLVPPGGMQGMMQPPGYPMGPQYHQFPNDRSNVQQFDRNQDFSHQRQSWDQSVNRPSDNMQYQGPQGPPQGSWNRPNRGGGGGPPVQPQQLSPGLGNRNLNERGRAPDLSRNTPFNRDIRDPSFNRDTRDSRDSRDSRDPRDPRDPRIRPEVPATTPNNPPAPAPNPRREHSRFTKETPQPPPPLVPKRKDSPIGNDRNQRRRGNDPKSKEIRKRGDKKRTPSKTEKKREKESEVKITNEKTSKDIMQSPLESLYGVIDTTAKTGKGYGLQKFKIPKIRRSGPVSSPVKIGDPIEEDWNDDGTDVSKTSEKVQEVTIVDISQSRNETDDKKAEVTSTTNETSDEPRIVAEPIVVDDNSTNKETSVQSTESEKPKLPESEQTVDTSTKNADDPNPSANESETPKLKDEFTQELIEAVIRKSLESGEIKKFLENSTLGQKLGEAFQAKKFKKIQKIIDSESESSSEKDEKLTEIKKTCTKKKRRVIVSDSSEEECLAERLDKIDTSTNGKTMLTESRVEATNNEEEISEKIEKGKKDGGNHSQDTATSNANEFSDGGSRDEEEAPNKKGKPFRRKKRERKAKLASSTKEQAIVEVESVVETNREAGDEKTTEEKSTPEIPAKQPSAKPKPKRRNSLEMLQEDIREMFISEGVVTATGHRMCRLIKEAQDTLNPLSDSNAKKSGSTTSLDHQTTKIDSDDDDSMSRPQSVNSKGRRRLTRNRKRVKGKSKTSKAVQEIASSDSEEVEDLTRVETNRDESSEGTKILNDSTSLDGSKGNKEDSESSHFLRRSERVGLRESMKDPKGLCEKTDIAKIESSKTMFDSSSDESFGIDVSELAAAVDISLHPESRGRITSSPVSKGSSTEKSPVLRKKKSLKGKRASVMKVEKVESVASADEVESIASDLSRASSLTRGKKAASNALKSDTNEELLSDFFTGLVDSKTGENESESTPVVDPKAAGRKKKKKKASWALGIVKKKKKKFQSPIPTPSIEMDSEATTRSDLETSFEATGTKMNVDEFGPTADMIGESLMDLEPKQEILTDETAQKSIDGSVDSKLTEEFTVPKEEIQSPRKNVLDDKKSLENLLQSEKNDVELDPAIEGEFKSFGNRRLLTYVWSSKKDRYNCLLCPWNGKNIVHHYALIHTGKETMISRFSIIESERAIAEALGGDYNKRTPGAVTKEIRKFTCRFCDFTTEGSPYVAVEAFYEHCTTHTGEYRFRCTGCTYQTVAKSSMKTHYYRRICSNRDHAGIHSAIIEDPVPNDDFLYGYMCSKCYFVQLKEINVEKHLKLHHAKIADAHIVKIDMSSYLDEDLYDWNENTEAKAEPKQEKDQHVEAETSTVEDPEIDTSSDTTTNVGDSDKPGAIVESLDKEVLKNEKDAVEGGKTTEEQSESETVTNEAPPVAGNLSAFVCPPDLENKEDEIQLERQKKMQEIVKNIGILNKVNEKRDLSIIDKLKDKMTETRETPDIETEETLEGPETASPEDNPSLTLPVLLLDSVTSLASGDDPVDKPEETSQDSIKDEPVETTEQSEQIPKDEMDTDTEDKSEKKPKDPLTNLDEDNKDESSDDGDDESDNDTVLEQPQSYDSDTSTEQSDTEIPADVNSLLEETFSINSTSNAPMMTTIQRLAAKLQSEKPAFSTSAGSSTEKSDDSEQQISEGNIPKKPNAIPISSIQRFLGRRNAMLQEVAKEVGEGTEDNDTDVATPNTPPISEAAIPSTTPMKTPPPASPPKKFIRLRRLSGDKLSVPGPVEIPVEIVPIGVSRSSSVDATTSDAGAEIIRTDNDDECSFLRIENVVSLAPGAENELMIDDIRKAVASPLKTQATLSLLKKPGPNILKRSSLTSVGGNLPIRPAPTMPTSSTPVRAAAIPGLPVPIMPVPPQGKQNFKIVKVVRNLTMLKQKDSTHRIFGVKLKAPETFTAMLQPSKLRHFYKCMSRGCAYTTDCQHSFGLHYRHHKDNVDRSNGVMTTYDFQRCAYCSETLTTWNAMNEHLKDKHIYCQFQCNYCFYRALAQSYVELHQASVHPLLQPTVLVGHRESPPIEVIDRREFVIPFVCHHECGKSFYVPGAFLAHLRTKHGNSLSIFKCHMCPAPSFKAEQLVAHYKLHGIYKYQCLYCLFGSENSNDVHAHLSASHYNRPPHILERTLQPRPVRDKDVIQQLIVVNVDETYKCTELTLAPGQDLSEVPKNKHWIQVDRNTAIDSGAAVGEVTLPIGNIGMNRLFSYDKLEGVDTIRDGSNSSVAVTSPVTSPATPVITKFRKISPKPPAENVLIVDDNGTIRKISKIKENVAETSSVKNVPGTSEATITATGDPPRGSVVVTTPKISNNRVQCNEEFLNFNILDNPEFLKVVENINNSKTSIAPVEIKDDDSDIEILEDIDISTNKSTMSSLPEKPVSVSLKKLIIAMEEETKFADTRVERQPVIVCSSNENSSDLTVEASSTSADVDETFDRPLSLDDIKGTGFTGVQLYRCGYDGCEFGAETATLLRTHIKECLYTSETKNLNCVHCNKRFVKIGFLVEHFKLHGLKRFGCSMCKDRWPMPYQAMSHMKSKHKQTYTKLKPADPKNPSVDGLFIVEPIPTNGTSRTKKQKRIKSIEKEGEKPLTDLEKVTFGPNDIETLPRQAIYQREVQCAVCPYTTKVRTNIIRHLQLHAKDETVPESGPVNPVPCLDKKERMFDKMVNLASSSHQNGRMGGKTKEPPVDNDAEFLPKFIPEHKRYVCGVTECNYLTCDESMLRYHLKALHPDEQHFRCPHCPAPMPGNDVQNVAIDKMAVHLKMHDTRLYKCSHCNNHHYHRHVVERHLSDKHADMSPYVKVIREPDTTESVQQPPSQEDGDESTADPDGNHWKCNLCDHKCVYKAEMVTHAANSHEEKGQFKCNSCSYKTNNKISFDQHVNAKHTYDINADCTLVYQKIKGVAIKKPASESVESGILDEPFDTTPLWRRDMPRVRHIRGILFEDEGPSKPESSGKSNKRKSDTDANPKATKSKPGKSTASDVSSLDNDSPWNGAVSSENSMSDFPDGQTETETGKSTLSKIDTAKLIRKFGPFGEPISVFYRCTICQTFKTKYRYDMRDHLYRDLKYWRYRCKLCGYRAVNKTSGLKHFTRIHENRRPTEVEQEPLPVDHEIESWVQAFLKSQAAQMNKTETGTDGNVPPESKTKKTASINVRRSTTASSQKTDANVAQSLPKNSNLNTKTVDLTKTIRDMEKKPTSSAANLETDDMDVIVDDDDEDSRDMDALVIDSKEEDLENEDTPDEADGIDYEPEMNGRTYTCRRCNTNIKSERGIKLHLEMHHLRRLKFLCPYCDTSSNSEKIMFKHLDLWHPAVAKFIKHNPIKNPPELSNDFWEKEYYVLPSQQRTKKRKHEEDRCVMDPFSKTPGVFHVCNKCGFRAINYFGLRVHMRRHATSKNFKCAYCTFSSATKSELWQHSELNHANLDWKIGNGDVSTGETSDPITKTEDSSNERVVENYQNYVEEVSTASTSSTTPKADMMYSCFYCNSEKTTLEGVRDHWKMMHQSTTKIPGETTTQRTGLPFRYKEIPVNTTKNCLRCGYCPKRGTAAQIRLHSRKKHSSKPVKFVEIPIVVVNWICQWCKEVCDSDAKKKFHHNMFHSHLTASFKRQEVTSEKDTTPGHGCPECSFRTMSRVVMEKHVEKHVDSVICKRCDKTFADVGIGILHNTQSHPGEVSKIEGFKTNVEKMLARVNWRNDEGQERTAFETVGRAALDKNWKSCGVAKKSTTKSSVSVKPVPLDFKAVARKSTNPLPRYPPGIRFAMPDDVDTNEASKRERCVSYYGKPVVPVNFTNINTYITLGGGPRMKLNCTTLAQLIDIEPRVVVEDLKRNFKTSVLSSNKT